MAEQKRVTRKGTRAMMRPKPRRVTGRDPFKSRERELAKALDFSKMYGGAGWYDAAYKFARTYGGGAEELVRLMNEGGRRHVDVFIHDTPYMIDDCGALHELPEVS